MKLLSNDEVDKFKLNNNEVGKKKKTPEEKEKN